MKNTDKKFLNKRSIVAIICIWIISIILIDVLKNGTWSLDYPIYNFIKIFKSDVLTLISKILARIGGRAGLSILTFSACLISLIKYKNKKVAILIIINMMIVGALNFGIKSIIQRPRPSEIMMIEVPGYSFPSGHTMGAMGFWGLLLILAFYNIKDANKKTIIISALCFIIFTMGMSRIYLGVHYASDVVCGVLITIIYYCVVIPVIKKVGIPEKNCL